MWKGKKFVPLMLCSTGAIMLLFLLLQPLSVLQFREYIAILFPKGMIALEERNLLLIIQAIMLLIVLPVYVLTYVFSWKYSAQNPKGRYEPELADNVVAEFIWWGLPLCLTVIVAILTWVKTHELDPFRPIPSDKPPKTIQVVALQWKWLFIYPEEKIASVNFVQFPTHVPIRFEITADAPMNSFWIPHLGGQIYAMPTMKTELNLIADEAGEYRGSSANLSGEGFAGMHFIAKASTEESFQDWIKSSQQSAHQLDFESYKVLAAPTTNQASEVFQLKDADLFNQIVMRYMSPSTHSHGN